MRCGWWNLGGTSIQPVGALNPRRPGRVMLQRYQQRRDPAVVIAQQQAGLSIDTSRRQRPTHRDLIRRAEEVLGEGHHVDAQIEHGAAALGRVEQPVSRVVRPVDTKIGL